MYVPMVLLPASTKRGAVSIRYEGNVDLFGLGEGLRWLLVPDNTSLLHFVLPPPSLSLSISLFLSLFSPSPSLFVLFHPCSSNRFTHLLGPRSQLMIYFNSLICSFLDSSLMSLLCATSLIVHCKFDLRSTPETGKGIPKRIVVFIGFSFVVSLSV